MSIEYLFLIIVQFSVDLKFHTRNYISAIYGNLYSEIRPLLIFLRSIKSDNFNIHFSRNNRSLFPDFALIIIYLLIFSFSISFLRTATFAIQFDLPSFIYFPPTHIRNIIYNFALSSFSKISRTYSLFLFTSTT